MSSLHELVIDAAGREPARPAIAGPSGTLTYGELSRQADLLACRLAGLGVGRGDRVVIWAGKSAKIIAVMQAALRLAAAYVPADGTTPARRVAAMARDCQARAVVTAAARIPRIAAELGSGARYLDLDRPPDGEAEPVCEPVAASDLACILCTSGATGTPKGVCVSHGGARACADWAAAELGARAEDLFANHAPLSFGLSVLDLYVSFSAGACMHLVPGELSFAPLQLVEFLYRKQISTWRSVPSALAVMMCCGGLLERPAPRALRAVLFTGEPFPIGQVLRLRGWTSARLLNLYGAAETNLCTFREVIPADLERDRPVPIGIPASGNQVWAERPDGTAAGPGDEGELVVAGPTVMLGYWGQQAHRGPYRTGDVARVLDDGSFGYLGRRDHLLKIRGHRVELCEVESVLASHAEVAEAAAVLAGHGADARLVAFVAPQAGREPGALALRQHSAEHLPRYMVADEVHILPGLPRAGAGKIDRLALAARAEHRGASARPDQTARSHINSAVTYKGKGTVEYTRRGRDDR